MSTATAAARGGSEILVVEDSPTQTQELKHYLEQRGHAVTLARDGREALAHLNGYRPALVISDINMPVMNGYELCRRLKADEATRPIPVVLLTVLADIEDLFQALACGADSFITKPYSGESLLDHIENMLTYTAARTGGPGGLQVEIDLAGKPRLITAEPQRMITMLIAAFEATFRRNSELAQTQQALRFLNDHLEDLVTERTAVLAAEIVGREALQTALQALSLDDELTGLHNRRGFMTLAEQYWRLAGRAHANFALIYVDVDNFKRINDTFGHAVGDQALLTMARLLEQTFRDCDILARLGGDEFAILLTDCDAAAAQAAAERLSEQLKQANAAGQAPYTLVLSLGLACFNPKSHSSIHYLLEQADADMYVNKRRKAERGGR